MNAYQFSEWLERKNQPSSWNTLEKPLIMGIVNATSDSFSDGGAFLSVDKACHHAKTLIAQGADIIDIGGESTRPGAFELPLEKELARVIPVIEGIRSFSDVCISIDTYKPAVMQAAVEAGADVINDIFALQSTGALEMAAFLAVPVCLMHMQGIPKNMQQNPQYPNGLVTEVMRFFEERMQACNRAGIYKSKLMLDPGFGFGKTVEHNLVLMKHIQDFARLKVPILLGFSRKNSIGVVLNKGIEERLIGGIALTVYAALKGVGILRTHDVDETNQALQMIDAVTKEVG
ncbi:MAG: dihydropteroate synthase [Legionellales bacterium]